MRLTFCWKMGWGTTDPTVTWDVVVLAPRPNELRGEIKRED